MLASGEVVTANAVGHSLPARNEWGESRREGWSQKRFLLSPALSSFLRQEEREVKRVRSTDHLRGLALLFLHARDRLRRERFQNFGQQVRFVRVAFEIRIFFARVVIQAASFEIIAVLNQQLDGCFARLCFLN